jgi:membrane protein implicated in regulation of membrane protease activity
MKRSVKVAAKLNAAALLVILLCAIAMLIDMIIVLFTHSPPRFAGNVTIVCSWLMGLAFVIALVCMLHIATTDAIQRMERSEKGPNTET